MSGKQWRSQKGKNRCLKILKEIIVDRQNNFILFMINGHTLVKKSKQMFTCGDRPKYSASLHTVQGEEISSVVMIKRNHYLILQTDDCASHI